MQLNRILKLAGAPGGALSEEDLCPDEHVPLSQRFGAWWHGEYVPKTVGSRVTPGSDADATTASAPSDSPRIRFVQELWGDGFLEPGGSAAVRRLFAEVKPNSKQSVLDITAGLGGTALALAQDLNLWMDAAEPNLDFAAEARRLARSCDLDSQVPVARLNTTSINLPDKKYHLIYSRERLFAIAEKTNILSAAAKALRKDGRLVITDYISTREGGLDPEALRAWSRSNQSVPEPWTIARYSRVLEQYGLKIVARRNMTKEHQEDVHAGWKRLLKTLRGNGSLREHGDEMLAEGDMWYERTCAFDAGDLALWRIIARAVD